MVDFVIKTVLSCNFDKTYVVVSRETLNNLSPVRGADYIVNPDPDRGQDSSFHCALSVLPVNSSFAVFLGDLPSVTAKQIIKLRRSFESCLSEGKNKTALVPRKDGAPGHPAFYTYLWRERFLASGEGVKSSKKTLFRHEDEVEWADADESCFMDVDTPDDYRRLIET